MKICGFNNQKKKIPLEILRMIMYFFFSFSIPPFCCGDNFKTLFSGGWIILPPSPSFGNDKSDYASFFKFLNSKVVPSLNI